MSGIKRILHNVKSLTFGKGINTLQTSDETSITSLPWGSHADSSDKQAVFPNWFFSARLGQPRQVDTRKIRNLAQSPWVQMVLTTFKKQIYTTEWKITNVDPEDETDYVEETKIIKDFMHNLNEDNQSIDDVCSEVISDVGEIDAGVWNFVYSSDSYVVGEIPIYDGWGRIQSTETGLILKPLGQRTITQVKSVDGSTMLKQIDLYKNLLNYWQYSFKHPRQNPTRFEKDEIHYMIMNKRPYSIYGFSPVQSIQQVVELLIQGTRYNKDLYTNNAVPDIMVSLPKLPTEKLKKLKRVWNENYQGKPHQVGFINWAIENLHKLNDSNRDLEWLNGQQWYFKIVFGAFGVSPEEAGFTENSNRATGDSQERVTVRNALSPYYKMLETSINNRLIPEILQDANPKVKFEYCPKDQEKKKTEFEQQIKELELGIITVNEYRKLQGKESVEWGDEPLRRPFDPADITMNNFGNPNPNAPPKKEEKFKKSFERFLNGHESTTTSE